MTPALATPTPVDLLPPDRYDRFHNKAASRIDEAPEQFTTSWDAAQYLDAWSDAHRDIVNTLLGGKLRQTYQVKQRDSPNELPATLQGTWDRYLERLSDAKNIIESTPQGDPDLEWLQSIRADLLDKLPTDTAWAASGMIGKTRAGRVIERWRVRLQRSINDTRCFRRLAVALADVTYLLTSFNNSAAESLRAADVFRKQSLTLHISADPVDIERLGEYSPCRSGSSCYRRGGQFGFAPLSLVATPGSFVALLADSEGTYIARAWGIWDSTNRQALLTNAYPYTGSPIGTVLLDAFADAMKAIGLVRTTDAEVRNDEDESGIYLNGGWVGFAESPDDCPRFYLDGYGIEPQGCTCADCGDRFDCEDDGIYVESLGQVGPCCSDRYIWINDDYYRDSDVVYDYAGEPIIPGNETELFDGEYAADDDPDLIELHDGTYAVEGHHSVIVLHDGSYGVPA